MNFHEFPTKSYRVDVSLVLQKVPMSLGAAATDVLATVGEPNFCRALPRSTSWDLQANHGFHFVNGQFSISFRAGSESVTGSTQLCRTCGFNHPRMAEGLARGCFRGSIAPRGFPHIKHGLIWRKQVEGAMAGLEFQDVSSMFQMLKPKKQSPQAPWTFFMPVRKFQDQTSSKDHLGMPLA